MTLLLPVLGSALGIDGGAIFQIFATEDLGLSSTAIGIAFGLGVLSLPVQIWAAGMPLWRARRNLQIFLGIAAAQAWILALLVARGRTGNFAEVALGVTVTAEIALSVLFATAWQPLLSQALPSVGRQLLNSRGRAVGGAVLAVASLVFAALNQTSRVVFLVVVGLIALWSALGLRRLAAPGRPEPAAPIDEPVPRRQPIPARMRLIYTVFALVNLGAWPLLLIYLHEVLWPAANLGLVAALQLAGSLVMSLAWRPTAAGVVVRARIAGVALIASGMVLAALRPPIERGLAQSATLAAIVVAAGSIATIRIAMLELAHRYIDEASSVRAFTLLDVMASTSLQLGLFAGGLLVAFSSKASGWLVDPYRIYVVVCSAAALVAIGRVRTATDDPAVTAGAAGAGE